MTFVAGDIVALKSGGQAMTIAEIHGDNAVCLWVGEEGDFFRETIPTIALITVDLDDEDKDEDHHGVHMSADHDDGHDEDEEEEAEHEQKHEKATA